MNHIHFSIECSCGTQLLGCKCWTKAREVRIVQDGCQECLNRKSAVSITGSPSIGLNIALGGQENVFLPLDLVKEVVTVYEEWQHGDDEE